MTQQSAKDFNAWGRLLLGVYSLLMALAVICLLRPHRWLRGLMGREHRQGLRELLGETGREPQLSPNLVIHAVSAGEMVAAGVIVRQLQPLRPDLRLILTTRTAAGLEIGRILQRDLPCVCGVFMLPWDRAGAMRRWLEYWSPQALIVVETELWPNLFNACRRQGIALALVSGRLYPDDVWKYRLIRGFMAQVLACPQWIAVQDETERQRFLSIGADLGRLAVLGNAKFASPPPLGPLSHRIQNMDGSPVRLVVAGSTHAPEELWLLDLLPALRDKFPEVRMVLAPRHHQRAANLARISTRRGWNCCRLSQDDWRNIAWEVLILDRMGQLSSFYSGADVVIMGGSMANLGGHNFMEAAWLACPILVGPHLMNFEQVAQRFFANGALCLARSRAEIGPRLIELLENPTMARNLGLKARECAEREGRRARGYGHAIGRLLERDLG